ncbi:hypothetical protein HY498_02240 [Candidatus Woesearchaeota archaeon]|nr:hypothetical protein [Candidatus Woesearchaeota archaeon]
MEYRVRNEKIIIEIWLNNGKDNVIFSQGMPQYLTKYHSLVKKLKKLKINLFIPRFPGTWESGGKFSIEQCQKAIEQTIKLAKVGEAIELYNEKKISWPTEKIYLLGFSFGCLPSLLCKELVDYTILAMPFVNLKIHNKNGGEDIKKTFDFLEKAYPNIYRFKANDVIRDLKNINYPIKKDNLIVIVGNKDKSIPKEEASWLEKKYKARVINIESKHSIDLPEKILKEVLSK